MLIFNACILEVKDINYLFGINFLTLTCISLSAGIMQKAGLPGVH